MGSGVVTVPLPSPGLANEWDVEEDEHDSNRHSWKTGPVVLQKMKFQQPLVPRGDLAGPIPTMEHTTYCPYMQAEPVNLELILPETWEPLAAWLLHLCDLGVDKIMCTDRWKS